jgi:hypothetical protein
MAIVPPTRMEDADMGKRGGFPEDAGYEGDTGPLLKVKRLVG